MRLLLVFAMTCIMATLLSVLAAFIVLLLGGGWISVLWAVGVILGSTVALPFAIISGQVALQKLVDLAAGSDEFDAACVKIQVVAHGHLLETLAEWPGCPFVIEWGPKGVAVLRAATSGREGWRRIRVHDEERTRLERELRNLLRGEMGAGRALVLRAGGVCFEIPHLSNHQFVEALARSRGRDASGRTAFVCAMTQAVV